MTRIRYWRYFGTYSIRKDATRDVYTAENRVVEAFGKRPDYDPAATHEHGQWAEAVNCDAELEERAADLEAKRREHAALTRPWFLRLTIAALFIAELISCVLVFAARGVEPPERIIFGAALAAGIFLVTFYLVEHGTTSEPGGEP